MSHLVVSISGHGFGHVAQAAPVLNCLHQLAPQLRLTVRSAVPLAHLRSRIHVPFTHLPSEGDIGMMMTSSVDVDVPGSRAAYHAFHACWEARIAAEAQLLQELGADMVLSNVGYLPLAGAQQAGIPNVALCSLNWLDIYRHYCVQPDCNPVNPSSADDERIAAQMLECYAAADAFLRITPGLAMDSLPNVVPIAPIAAVGHNRRDELGRYMKLSREEKLVLVSLGGIADRLPIERWPRIDGVRWLVQENWHVERADAIALESLPMNFSDLLASSDVLLCKPGYGSFVEAACSGIPVLYASRPDWPETPALSGWLQLHGRCREVSRNALERGELAGELRAVCHIPHPAAVVPEGAEQAARWIGGRLQNT